MSTVITSVPADTLAWLTEDENPAVAVMTRRLLLSETDSPELDALWYRRNDYAPVKRILDAMREDGSWAPPPSDYQKYNKGSLWQIHFLGELYARGNCHRVQRAGEYAFSRQRPDGSWSINGRADGAIPCLTANVGRALARLGWSGDEQVVAALAYNVRVYRELGLVGCRGVIGYNLNGYCHMLAPKTLLFLAEVPHDLWPDGAEDLRDACIDALRDKSVFQHFPAGVREFQAQLMAVPPKERVAFRERYLAEHGPLEYGLKPGWLRFGYPLTYNSDVLEALASLMAIGEPMREKYAEALAVVRDAAGPRMRWTMKNSFNGKMLADVEVKGQPSKWLTLRALLVLKHFGVDVA